MAGQTANQRDRMLAGADRCRPRARQRQSDFVERTALPADREVCCRLVALNPDDNLLDECLQQLLPVARRGGRGVPNLGQIGRDGEQMVAFLRGEQAGMLLLATFKVSFGGVESAQTLFPLALEPTRNQAVIGINSTVS